MRLISPTCYMFRIRRNQNDMKYLLYINTWTVWRDTVQVAYSLIPHSSHTCYNLACTVEYCCFTHMAFLNILNISLALVSMCQMFQCVLGLDLSSVWPFCLSSCCAFCYFVHLCPSNGVVVEWWCSVPSVGKVAGLNPTIAASLIHNCTLVKSFTHICLYDVV